MPKVTKQPVLTLDEHQALGTELWAARRRFDELAVDLSARYPVRVGDAAHRVAQTIDALRGVLDSLLYRERRGEDRTHLHEVYYPKPPAA